MKHVPLKKQDQKTSPAGYRMCKHLVKANSDVPRLNRERKERKTVDCVFYFASTYKETHSTI